MSEKTRPHSDEVEITLFGPGYGESMVLHLGNDDWVVVDSCIDQAGEPRALQYLRSLRIDPARSVKLVVATHWHDDHIRGMAKLVENCLYAEFCCAGALCKKEFLTMVGVLGGHSHPEALSSGVQEIHEVISLLSKRESQPKHALADRLVFRHGSSKVWSLSPSDSMYQRFLKSIRELRPDSGQPKRRISPLSPNDVAVALLFEISDTTLLLGSDLERRGWIEILRNNTRSDARASVYKVPHHGSKNADDPQIWQTLLDPKPWALVTPWSLCGRSLPRKEDIQRITQYTSNAYATSRAGTYSANRRRSNAIERTIRESGISLKKTSMSSGSVRLRKQLNNQVGWNVETFGTAFRLS